MMGNISLGIDLVAGRKRVPMPPTGKTALLIFFMLNYYFRQFLNGVDEQIQELVF